jgi:hypothetical protein
MLNRRLLHMQMTSCFRQDAELIGIATGTACEGCPPLADLLKRYEAAGGRYYVCPICFSAKNLSADTLIGGAELQGTVPMWAWIGDEAATTFSY